MNIKDPAQTSSKCRLAVKFARSAPVAILLRRGPTDWVQLITWRLDDDRFEPGQWFKGRVYEDLCDLSEDGELFLYSARKSNSWTTRGPDKIGETWTALSRPPYFTALALWPNRCWDGGGMFTGARHITLDLPNPNAQSDYPATHLKVTGYPMPNHQPRRLSTLMALRDGWQPMTCLAEKLQDYDWRRLSPLEKTGCKGSVRIIRTTTRDERYRTVDHFSVLNAQGEIDLGTADFVDFDTRDRLVAGQAGRLRVCSEPTAAQLDWHTLADFSSARPQPLPPTEWASTWPAPHQLTHD